MNLDPYLDTINAFLLGLDWIGWLVLWNTFFVLLLLLDRMFEDRETFGKWW